MRSENLPQNEARVMAYLAQLNLAKLRAPKGDPLTQEFFTALDPINALAESASGFVWRLVGDVSEHTDIEFFLDPSMVVNLSVWNDADSFKHFVYQSGHVQYIKRKKEWFHPFDGPHAALWWVDEDHLPDLSEAYQKWRLLKEKGPSSEVFGISELASQRPRS